MANPRNRGVQWGTILLGSQLMNVGLQNVPPVTLALIVGQTLVFLEAFPETFPSPMKVCMSSYLVYYKQEYIRMLKGSLYHGDDMHLYFNMLSLLYKGSILEQMYGGPYYAYLIGAFTGLTSASYISLGLLLHRLTGDASYLNSCAVGFSGVLFALKVLVTLASPSTVHYIQGIPIPSRFIFWVELILIQLASPNASFVGHLAGILVGLAYVKGPLKYLMDFFLPSSIYRLSNRGNYGGRSSRRWFSSGGPSGRRAETEDIRRNPTFQADSIFNQEPPNLHENFANTNRPRTNAQPSSPLQPRSSGSDFSRPRSSYTRTSLSAPYGRGAPTTSQYQSPPYGQRSPSTSHYSSNPYDRIIAAQSYRNYIVTGYDEEEDYRRAIEESLKTSNTNYPNN